LVDKFAVDMFIVILEQTVSAVMDKPHSKATNLSGDRNLSNRLLKDKDMNDMMKRGDRMILMKGLNLRPHARRVAILVRTSEWK
jgi:hypothetical protein